MSDQKIPLSPPGHPSHPPHPPVAPQPPVVPQRPGAPLPLKPPASAVPNTKPPAHDTSAIDLVDEKEAHIGTKIQAYGVAQTIARQTQFKRHTHVSGTGVVRIRTFHGRLSDEGLAFMDEKINQWLDDHPDIEIKIVNTTVGPYEGKIKEPCLIVNVWY